MRIRYLILSIVLLGSCKSKISTELESRELPYYQEATFTPFWLSPNAELPKDFHSISDFNFINQEGTTISLKTFEDKIYVTDFFFTTCPGICPKMTANLSLIQNEFKNETRLKLLSHSVTPSRDTVPVLKAYAIDNGINSDQWHLVTGDQQEIYNMGRNDYFIEEDLGLEREPDEFLHTENFVLVDQDRHIRGIYNGLNKASIQNLISDIRVLLNEESP